MQLYYFLFKCAISKHKDFFFPFLKKISLIRGSLHSCDTMVVFAIHVDGWHDGMMGGMSIDMNQPRVYMCPQS